MIGFGLRFHRKLGIREFFLSSSPASIFTLRENLEEYYAGAALTLRIRLQIYKKKGSCQDLNNDRGIFVVSVMRMILDSLTYAEKYPEVDKNMSDSNIGARRDIRNHLFVVYGVINSVLNGSGGCMDIQIYDVEKCFDAPDLEIVPGVSWSLISYLLSFCQYE
jgi:hypothetical protein